MTSLLVFGATGSVGGYLLPRLGSSQRVHAVSRKLQPSTEAVQWIRADLFRPADLPSSDGIISLGPLDAFSHWLASNSHHSPRRVIAFSSMSASTKFDSPDIEERLLAKRLIAAESELFKTCTERQIACTVFRPTLIYGAGGDRSLTPIAKFARRWRCLPIPTGATGLRQPVHAADLAEACMSALENPATFGKTYPLGGAERLRFDEMLRSMRAAIPGFIVILPIPFIALHTASRRNWLRGIKPAMLNRLSTDLIADNSAANRDFGYRPRKFIAADACR